MSTTARQLFQLQECDIALETNEQSQVKVTAELADNQEVTRARAKLAAEQKRLEELTKQQKTTEWECDDLTAKIKVNEKKLYDGKITNSKELSNLQADTEDIKKRRSALEDKVLGLMEESDEARAKVAALTQELARIDADWQTRHSRLTADMEHLKADRGELEARRQALLAQIDAPSAELYRELRKRKGGLAVAKVEQGTCKGCRIALPNSDLQQAKSGGLVRCSSCGRILYLP